MTPRTRFVHAAILAMTLTALPVLAGWSAPAQAAVPYLPAEDETQAGSLAAAADLPMPAAPKPRPVDVVERILTDAHGLELTVDDGLRGDLLTLARNIYFEARGENLMGQTAVAFVTLNRVESELWPNSIDEVVYQPYQFSWTRHTASVTDFEAFEVAARIALLSLAGYLDDPTGGADHYYAPERVKTPNWARRFTKVARIDGHVFFTASAN